MNAEPELHDKTVLEFATYEDYLDQHVSAEDLYYLEVSIGDWVGPWCWPRGGVRDSPNPASLLSWQHSELQALSSPGGHPMQYSG